ncbi:MAG TPA: hypothetical protein PLD75_05660 [Spirochaetota bacterium]|nr:hypothetical protein [Spirochaetota bacterium]
MNKFLDTFGKNVKAVISGMILGLFLLPLGVYMQYCAVNQMQYHKEFKAAKDVTDANDPQIKDATLIKTEGNYSLSAGPFSELKTPEGDMFSGSYISYDIYKYIIKEKKTEKKDSEGKPTGEYEYTYEWVKEGNALSQSPADLSVSVNGFTVKLNAFRQNYIPSATRYYKYTPSRTVMSNMEKSTEGTGFPPSPTEDEYRKGIYAIVLEGRIYDATDTTMTISGVASKGSSNLVAKQKKVFASLPQEMLVISYGNKEETLRSLESQAKTERLFKFIIGTLCFMFGFSGLFGPIIKVLDLIPFLGKMATSVIYFILAIVSLLLSVLFYIFFQIFWLLVAAVIVIVIVLIVMKTMKKSQA